MTLYLVPRTRVWQTEEEVAAAADCVPYVNDALGEHVRWIRSYVVREPDGSFSAYCLYEASSEDMLRMHAEALRLPADGVKPVAATLVHAADPEPLRTV